MFQKLKSALFHNTSTRQTIAKNTFWLFGGEVIARFIRAAIVIYAASLLGAASYGVFSYAMAIAGFVSIFADVGLSQILTREVARDPNSRNQYLSTSLFLKAILILFNIGLVLFVAPLFTKIEAALPLFPIVVFILVFDTLRDFAFSLLRAMEKMEWEALAKIITNTAVAAAGFLMLLYQASAYSLALGYAIGTGIGFFVTMFILWPDVRTVFRHFNRSLIKTIIAAAWPIGVLALLGTIMLNTDMVMLGWMRTAEEVGAYAAAQKIVLLLYMLPGLIASAIFPVMARLARHDDARLRSILEKGIAVTLLLAVPIVIGGIVLQDDIIRLVYPNSDFLPSIPVFAILLLTLLLISPSVILNNAILAYNKQKQFVWFFAIGATSNIILNAFLIPRFGIVGCAWATLGSQILSTLLIFITMKKINPFSVTRYVPKLFFASIVMGGFTYLLQSLDIHIIVNLATSAVLYFTLLAALKEPLLKEARQMFR